MRVWRICRRVHPPVDGEGARIHGARWNSRGNPVAYTAGSLALAIVELLVHTDPDLIPDDLTAYEVDIPDHLSIRRISREGLPERWDDSDDLSACQTVGDAWLQAGDTCVLAVPSAIVPEETNYLINPAHPEAAEISIVTSRSFEFDPRLLR